MLPWFQHWSNHMEAPGGILLRRCSRTFKAHFVLSFQVREELEAQLSRFRELLGRNPTHVDGHQHVHVLPGALVGGPRQGAVCLGGGTCFFLTPPRLQACAKCSLRCCRPMGCTSQGCRWSTEWVAARGWRPRRVPSPVPWSAMPGPLWALSPAEA